MDDQAKPSSTSAPPPPPPSRPKWVLPYKTQNLRDHYSIGRKLGQGQFGTTFLCTHKTSGNKYACKSIPKESFFAKKITRMRGGKSR
ncbi:unnamed protein product [Dovyalis caffra]|uniref:Calcium/calmodulin-dependent protein kinase n=1 Tax=Dovyalis caffra TaxID=77055 RepID=A0AAV1R5G8_9ROSI|nr:unnamed protein product [Dovyalis caffra]